MRKATPETKPCEGCGVPVTRTKTQQSQRRYWTCSRSCANKVRLAAGHVPAHWPANPLRGQKGTRPCAMCGAPVERYLNSRTADQTWYCSKSCRAKSTWVRMKGDGTVPPRPMKPHTGEHVPCAVCGKLRYLTRSQIKAGRQFCSRECNAIHQAKPPVVKPCGYCGKEMRLKPSQAAIQYCSRLCMGNGVTKRPLDRMHNGRNARLNDEGYVYVWEPDHPGSFHGWIYEHRLVAEQTIGRPIRPDEHVHHINEVKGDNRPENLEVLPANRHCSITTRSTLAKMAADRARLAALEVEIATLRARLADPPES
jgi:endogenous inhibitor of DNA gyrase (YacG/DUF329 family)